MCFLSVLVLVGCPTEPADTTDLDPNASAQQQPAESPVDDSDQVPAAAADELPGDAADEPNSPPEDIVEEESEPDPSTLDSDGDGLLDSFELSIGTDPNAADTDGDGLTDGQEFLVDLDPLTPDEIGVVVQPHCELAITISVDEASVYASDSGPEDFTRWNPGDPVVVTPISEGSRVVEIANATLSETAYTADWGPPVASGVITDVDHLSEEIEMGGTWWPANPLDAYGLWGWSAGDEAIVARHPVQGESYDAMWIMLNVSSSKLVLLEMYH